MLNPHNLGLFIFAALALLLIPGPSVLYITTRSIDQGRVAGLNPKTALFLLAFLPQFVDVSLGHVGVQTLLLGLMMVGMGICTDSTYALLAGSIGNELKKKASLQNGLRYISGSIYLALGIASAFSGSGKD